MDNIAGGCNGRGCGIDKARPQMVLCDTVLLFVETVLFFYNLLRQLQQQTVETEMLIKLICHKINVKLQ